MLDPNIEDLYGSNAFHYAVRGGHLDVIKYLVEERACDPKIAANNRITALYTSSVYGHLDVIKYLIEEGVILIKHLITERMHYMFHLQRGI